MVDYQMLKSDKIFIDYNQYRDKFGLQQPSNDYSTSENGIRFTAQYLIAIIRRKLFLPMEKVRLRIVIESCFRKPGLLMRSPENPRRDAIDNHVALGVLAKFLNPQWAVDVIEYGRKHRGFYDSITPNKPRISAFLWRHPQLFMHLKLAARPKKKFFIWPWEYLVWCVCLVGASKTRDQDSRSLTVMLCLVACGYSRFTDFLIRRFVRGFRKSYARGWGQLLGEYYQNPNHPDVTYLDQYFGPET